MLLEKCLSEIFQQKYHLKKVDAKEILIFDKIWFLEDFKCEPI